MVYVHYCLGVSLVATVCGDAVVPAQLEGRHTRQREGAGMPADRNNQIRLRALRDLRPRFHAPLIGDRTQAFALTCSNDVGDSLLVCWTRHARADNNDAGARRETTAEGYKSKVQ